MVITLLMVDLLLFVKTSQNKFVVQWGSDNDESRWKTNNTNSNGRAFRHICDNLTVHVKKK